jgi:hypothetical protein
MNNTKVGMFSDVVTLKYGCWAEILRIEPREKRINVIFSRADVV